MEYYILDHYPEDIEVIPFFPLQGRNYIKKHDKVYYNYSSNYVSNYSSNYSSNDVNVNLYIFDITKDNPEKIIANILEIINFVKTSYSLETQRLKSFTLDLYLTPLLKTLPSKNQKLTREMKIVNSIITDKFKDKLKKFDYNKIERTINKMNINSGVTEHSTSKITIWRKSEWDKVLIHELLHLWKLEKYHTLEIPKTIGISENYPRLPVELFCELQTWYLYCLYNKSNFYEEVEYSLFNLAKILNVFDIEYFNDFYECRTIINIKCSVEFYFIFKAMILYGIFLMPHGNNNTHGNSNNNKQLMWIIDTTANTNTNNTDTSNHIINKLVHDVAYDKMFNDKINNYLRNLKYSFNNDNYIYFMRKRIIK